MGDPFQGSRDGVDIVELSGGDRHHEVVGLVVGHGQPEPVEAVEREDGGHGQPLDAVHQPVVAGQRVLQQAHVPDLGWAAQGALSDVQQGSSSSST